MPFRSIHIDPELTAFLCSVDVFFSSLPHATRVLHKESFLQALSLPPTAAGFPETSILHAICAVASLFTSAASTPPVGNLSENPAGHYNFFSRFFVISYSAQVDDIFEEKFRAVDIRDHSFGDMQAKYAKEAQEESTRVGEAVFSSLQCKCLFRGRLFPLHSSLPFTSRSHSELVLFLPC